MRLFKLLKCLIFHKHEIDISDKAYLLRDYPSDHIIYTWCLVCNKQLRLQLDNNLHLIVKEIE